ncbi:acVLRF1 family peptidyl-tRNA hydrolase [Micromonospora sp. WMMD1120]|uniref:acVLRF1 family peptidyl-tRNA hydrolase n=1 Tax=Micromonospora sp. WMMD1120 TaxID=3016106 RepID=UPI0024177286|nr:acVLRF1 family peptidyl-tRNA hydrolase [Micromonospora sp. WMMD1120]MDG4811346.1 acVLRF1 family peptidyl-tRNA hydrolase [Micromonospora sp. WMMD1120]
MTSRPAAGGGRWLEVDPARVGRWVEGFADRHGPHTTTIREYGLLLTADDGATAELYAPPGAPVGAAVADFVAAAVAPRRIGLLLARKGAVAVGVAEGGDLAVSKVDSRYVQGRTAAGGWSQQRFARRRDNQAKAAMGEAADLAVRLLVPEASRLAALVCGGDRRSVDTVLADRRLAPLVPLRAERLLDVPEPRHAVLVAAVAAARAVRIRLRDPIPD